MLLSFGVNFKLLLKMEQVITDFITFELEVIIFITTYYFLTKIIKKFITSI